MFYQVIKEALTSVRVTCEAIIDQLQAFIPRFITNEVEYESIPFSGATIRFRNETRCCSRSDRSIG